MRHEVDVLLVSEDPGFLASASRELSAAGIRATACLGPAQGTCLLDTDGRCSLAAHATVVVVDSPASGSFERHTRSVRSGTYADRLARTHPDTAVLLAGAQEGYAGGSGEAVHIDTREQAIDLMLLARRGSTRSREETCHEGA